MKFKSFIFHWFWELFCFVFFLLLKYHDQAWIKVNHCCEGGWTAEGCYAKVIQTILSGGTGGQYESYIHHRLGTEIKRNEFGWHWKNGHILFESRSSAVWWCYTFNLVVKIFFISDDHKLTFSPSINQIIIKYKMCWALVFCTVNITKECALRERVNVL